MNFTTSTFEEKVIAITTAFSHQGSTQLLTAEHVPPKPVTEDSRNQDTQTFKKMSGTM